MSDYPRPAGLDAFARCPVAGCDWRVYAPFHIATRCKAHGGQPDLPQVREADPFGIPRAVAGDSSSPATRPSPEAA